MKNVKGVWPNALLLIFICFFFDLIALTFTTTYDLTTFGSLPVICNGRLQPLDSVARNALMVIHGRSQIRLSNHHAQGIFSDSQTTIKPIQWLLYVMTKPHLADSLPVFRIDNLELKDFLGLKDAQDRKYFSFKELVPAFSQIKLDYLIRGNLDTKESFDRAILRLYHSLEIYHKIKITISPELVEKIRSFQQFISTKEAFLEESFRSTNLDDQQRQFTIEYKDFFAQIDRASYFLMIPPMDKNTAFNLEGWQTLGGAALEGLRTGTIAEPALDYIKLLSYYMEDNPDGFNRTVKAIWQWFRMHHSAILAKVEKEALYNKWHPFYKAGVLYTIVFLIILFLWLRSYKFIWICGVILYGGALAFHTFGLIMRILIEGRPPVTNLYSSVIFVGWAAGVVALVIELISPYAIAIAAGALLGILSQIVAHQLSLGGETFELIIPVIDTNFWLATHVLTIALGYAAAFGGGFIAGFFTLWKLFKLEKAKEIFGVIESMVYGCICFSLLFTFLGTIFGGIWAERAWGRFWGWDPKENGALILLLWFALMLHARKVGIISSKGFINMAIGGNILTSFCWFGINMFGIGLHTYGLVQPALWGLVIFILINLILIGLNSFLLKANKK